MSNGKSIIIASCIIGVSFIVGCTFFGNNVVPNKGLPDVTISTEKPLLNIEEAADYLHLTVTEVNQIIKSEQYKLNSTGSFSGVMFPYIKIDDKYYISKIELQNWITETTRERREYDGGNVLQ